MSSVCGSRKLCFPSSTYRKQISLTPLERVFSNFRSCLSRRRMNSLHSLLFKCAKKKKRLKKSKWRFCKFLLFFFFFKHQHICVPLILLTGVNLPRGLDRRFNFDKLTRLQVRKQSGAPQPSTKSRGGEVIALMSSH